MGLWELIKQLIRFALAAWWNRITEQYGPGSIPDSQGAQYSYEYPKEYTMQYFRNTHPDYLLSPDYRNTLNRLYQDSVYEKRKHYQL
jgi:hypothetical protein